VRDEVTLLPERFEDRTDSGSRARTRAEAPRAQSPSAGAWAWAGGGRSASASRAPPMRTRASSAIQRAVMDMGSSPSVTLAGPRCNARSPTLDRLTIGDSRLETAEAEGFTRPPRRAAGARSTTALRSTSPDRRYR
jgi:hypothetical protein